MLSCRAAAAAVLLLACCATFIIADVIVFDHAGSLPLEQGDGCWDQSTNKKGVCRNITECISAIEAIKTKGATRPTTCGFEGNTVIVCCAYKGFLEVIPLEVEGATSPPQLPYVPVSLRQPFMKVACGSDTSSDKQPFYDRLGNPYFVSAGVGGRTISNLSTTDWATLSDKQPFYDRLFNPNIVVGAVGGHTPDGNAWPWMALLGWRENGSVAWRCDGSLINDRWVITAAHCFDKSPPVVVRLGEHDYTNDTDGALHQDFGISRYLSYPEYSSGLAYHDLALIELDNPVVFSKEKRHIAPVCLPWGAESTAYLLNRKAYLTGWGATKYGGEVSPVLQEVELTIFNSSLCNESYGQLPGTSIEYPRGITTQDFVCAGDSEGGKDACFGDSGGPLQYNSNDLGWVLTGVVAKGYGCGLADFPGLYTPIHNPRYLLWIRKVAFL